MRTRRYIENAFLCAVIRDRSPAHVAKMSVNLPWRSNALFRFSWCFYVWPVSRASMYCQEPLHTAQWQLKIKGRAEKK